MIRTRGTNFLEHSIPHSFLLILNLLSADLLSLSLIATIQTKYLHYAQQLHEFQHG